MKNGYISITQHHFFFVSVLWYLFEMFKILPEIYFWPSQINWWHMLFPKLSNCRFRVSGKMDKLCSARLGPLWWQCQLTLGQKKVCIRIHIFDSKKQTNKNKNTKKANRISLQNWLKNKFVAFPVHIFLIAHISG